MTPRRTASVVIYDGACVVRTRMIGGLREWDRRGALEILPSQDPSVRVRFPGITQGACAASIQLVEPDDRTWGLRHDGQSCAMITNPCRRK